MNTNEYNLTTRIINLSESSTWEIAKQEWSFTHAFQREGSECLCGKKNITNVCVISNLENNNTVEVGNCCVKKFMGIADGTPIFQTLNKLKKNIKAHIPEKLIETFGLNEEDIELYSKFYYGIDRKTGDDWNRKIEINKIFIDYFSAVDQG